MHLSHSLDARTLSLASFEVSDSWNNNNYLSVTSLLEENSLCNQQNIFPKHRLNPQKQPDVYLFELHLWQTVKKISFEKSRSEIL